MAGFTIADNVSLSFFIIAWIAYHVVVERALLGGRGLNRSIDDYRIAWMQEMSRRDVRIVDSAIMASLQNGTAFFASTSLIAFGTSAALLRSTDSALKMFGDLPFAQESTRGLWEFKVIGIAAIFGYAFFKFSWSYRLFNFATVMLGATPPLQSEDVARRRITAWRTAQMNIAAARHFSRGQRAFFFALAYIGWFVSPWLFMLATAAIVFVMAKRQYASDASRAITALPPASFDTSDQA